MSVDLETAALANAKFVRTVLERSADIFAGGQPEAECPTAYTALEQARDEFHAEEKKHPKDRTYGFPHLSVDLGRFIRDRHPQYADEWGVINRWSRETEPETVVTMLRESAISLSDIVADRTRTATHFDQMGEKERGEYLVMRKAVAFLKEEGIDIEVQWERKDPDAPIDYWGTIRGHDWAFEIVGLRKDPEGYHRKLGNPKERKSLADQLQQLGQPMPRIPDDAETLQSVLTKAVAHGLQANKVAAVTEACAKYCLVIHNWQFLYEPAWQEISYPDLSGYDAVLILHIDNIFSRQVWEVPHRAGLAGQLRSQTISDLADIDEFKASRRDQLAADLEQFDDMEEQKITEMINTIFGE